MATALAAARAGVAIHLLEAKPDVGGTVASALIHTLGGLYDSAGASLNDGLPRELADRLAAADATVCRRRMGRVWVLNVPPSTYQTVVRDWLRDQPGLTLHGNTRVTQVCQSAGRITAVEATGPRGDLTLQPAAVIDATGTAAVVRLLDPTLLQADDRRAAGGLIFRMSGVAPDALRFPQGLGLLRALREAAQQGDLPASCAKAWLDSGTRPDEVYVKLFVPMSNGALRGEESPACRAEARRGQEAVVAFLKRLPEFAAASVAQIGELGVRDGGRVHGEYCLTAEDVRQLRKFPDAACRCCWPIEYWDPEQGVSLEYLPDGGCYEIPLRALKVRGIANLWAVGKCLSADRYAQASARVVGTCWAMGEAAGNAAAGACQREER
jgi:hypothetical protein